MSRRLKIYKASAGAGKTHTLTYEYLRLALVSERAFEHIQAVTFTNKATEEMKARILRELHRLAMDVHRSPFGDELMESLALSAEKLSERAGRVLRHILMDYSRFRISTIDSFFQEVVRAFTRELGLQGNFRLELEHQDAIEGAISALLTDIDDLEASDDRVRWITDISRSLVLEGKNYDLARHLTTLGQELKREEVKNLILKGGLPSREDIKALRTALEGFIEAVKAEWAHHCERILSEYARTGLTISDLSRGANGALSLFLKGVTTSTPNADLLAIKPISAYLRSAHEDLETIFAKDNRAERMPLVERTRLGEYIADYVDFIERMHSHLYSAIYAIKELGTYGLIADIETKVKELQRGAGTLLLSDTPTLIHSIISDENGGAFVYEKIGSKIEHQMIDEFQDTSRMQYLDFVPLLEESLASGHENLIVGDVKQSIYRWRGSDSSLLGSEVTREFGEEADIRTLQHNWRSTPEVIHFNNAIYRHIATTLATDYRRLIELECSDRPEEDLVRLYPLADQIADYYADVEQFVPEAKREKHGAVLIHRFEEEELGDEEDSETDVEEEAVPEVVLTGERPDPASIAYQLPMTILDLQRRGFRPCDIAILVRRKGEAKAVSTILQEAERWLTPQERADYSLEFISGEALEVGSSPVARMLVAGLAFVAAPSSPKALNDLRALYRLVTQGENELTEEMETYMRTLGRRSLYETTEALVDLFSHTLRDGDYPYVIKLLDMVLGFQQDLSVDIADFLDLWGSTRGKGATLQASSDERRIQLMTIHKSKGLGFPAVLVPYPTWSLERDNKRVTNYLWCDNVLEAIDPELRERVPIMPVAYSSGLVKTSFAGDYLRERISLVLDALNMLYVTTTRASHELHLWMPEADPTSVKRRSKQEKNNHLDYTDIQRLLYDTLGQVDTALYLDIPSGEPVPSTLPSFTPSNEASTIPLLIKELTSEPLDGRVEVLRRGLGHFVHDSQVTYGTIMHRVFGQIETADELDEALTECLRSGELSAESYQEAFDQLRKALDRDEVRPWFDGSGQVLCEAPIIGGGLDDSRRPDRIVTYPDGSAVVVDYKFGKAKADHRTQVEEYMRLISSMGYAPVRGYLWYFSGGGSIVEVSPTLI